MRSTSPRSLTNFLASSTPLASVQPDHLKAFSCWRTVLLNSCLRVPYMFLRYCPPTSNIAAVSCPSEQYFVASINTSNMFSFRIAAC